MTGKPTYEELAEKVEDLERRLAENSKAEVALAQDEQRFKSLSENP